jgi:hypothetical protein
VLNNVTSASELLSVPQQEGAWYATPMCLCSCITRVGCAAEPHGVSRGKVARRLQKQLAFLVLQKAVQAAKLCAGAPRRPGPARFSNMLNPSVTFSRPCEALVAQIKQFDCSRLLESCSEIAQVASARFGPRETPLHDVQCSGTLQALGRLAHSSHSELFMQFIDFLKDRFGSSCPCGSQVVDTCSAQPLLYCSTACMRVGCEPARCLAVHIS